MGKWGLSAVAGCGLVLWAAGCATCPKASPEVGQAEHAVTVGEWVLLGTFPNPQAETVASDGSRRLGYGMDYLAALGGEAAAAIAADTTVAYEEPDGTAATATAMAGRPGAQGIVDLAQTFGPCEHRVAYAYAEVTATAAGTVECFLGSDDWVKVWVNGELVHARWDGDGRACVPQQDHFPVRLQAGANRLLLKIDQFSGPWGFVVEFPDAVEAAAILEREKRTKLLQAFRNTEVGPENPWGHCIEPGPLPTIVWRDRHLVEALWGDLPLTVRWFDGQLKEVTEAREPGRYAAYVEATTADGRTIRRAVNVFVRKPGPGPWEVSVDVNVPYVPFGGVDPQVWHEHQGCLSGAMREQFWDLVFRTDRGAALLAGLCESKPLGRTPTQLEWPDTLDQDYHLALKRRILQAENLYPALRPPRAKTGASATILRPGTPAQADLKADAPARLREACRTWAREADVPLTALVARHGVVAFHEAFGTDARPVDLGTRLPLASLTKTFTALMFAQFMDQGLIRPDDPVGRYLPDFPADGEQAVTLRHCLTHTSGLEGHGEWGGMHNPWLDNVIANGLETLQPGRVAIYNGMGLDLAGKVMEMVSGKGMFRLMHENFFTPLGMHDPTIEDLAYGIDCTVEDLARMGQLMLNRGAYGETEFFSPATFQQLMPCPYGDHFPELAETEGEVGLGLWWMRDLRPDAGRDGVAPDATCLSRNTIGHGAATGAVLRVDLDHDLVVAVCRPTPGPDYDKHLRALLQAVADSLAEAP